MFLSQALELSLRLVGVLHNFSGNKFRLAAYYKKPKLFRFNLKEKIAILSDILLPQIPGLKLERLIDLRPQLLLLLTSLNPFAATYTLDIQGNRIASSENINGQSRNLAYNYDELSRLITETSSINSASAISSTYVYDKVGNRTQMKSYTPPNTKSGTSKLILTTDYSYDNADRLTSRVESGNLTPFAGLTYNYGYDNNGSLTSETNTASGGEVTNYSYDARNRLIGWNKQAKGTILNYASFTYDGANTRLSMSYGGKTTNYLQDIAADLPVVLQESVISQTISSYLLPARLDHAFVPGWWSGVMVS